MDITPIKTAKIIPFQKDIFSVLETSVTSFSERCILAVSSKLIAICEGRVVQKKDATKQELIYREADFVLPPLKKKNFLSLTVTKNFLIPAAGIDESNGKGSYVLLPEDPQKSANLIRQYLCKRFHVHYVGVIITDSVPVPLQTGTLGIAIAHSGFEALRDYIGRPDLFGRKFEVTKASIINGLAAASVVVMGEGNEQTPFALIQNVPFVRFQRRNPTQKELLHIKISMKDDLYAPFFQKIVWDKGRRNRAKK